jgi:hypothetical protein
MLLTRGAAVFREPHIRDFTGTRFTGALCPGNTLARDLFHRVDERLQAVRESPAHRQIIPPIYSDDVVIGTDDALRTGMRARRI